MYGSSFFASFSFKLKFLCFKSKPKILRQLKDHSQFRISLPICLLSIRLLLLIVIYNTLALYTFILNLVCRSKKRLFHCHTIKAQPRRMGFLNLLTIITYYSNEIGSVFQYQNANSDGQDMIKLIFQITVLPAWKL